MAPIDEVANTLFRVVMYAYFPIAIVAMLLLKPVMERRCNVKIEWIRGFWDVSGGTRRQRIGITLIPIALGLFGIGMMGIAVLILVSHPTPSS